MDFRGEFRSGCRNFSGWGRHGRLPSLDDRKGRHGSDHPAFPPSVIPAGLQIGVRFAALAA